MFNGGANLLGTDHLGFHARITVRDSGMLGVKPVQKVRLLAQNRVVLRDKLFAHLRVARGYAQTVPLTKRHRGKSESSRAEQPEPTCMAKFSLVNKVDAIDG